MYPVSRLRKTFAAFAGRPVRITTTNAATRYQPDPACPTLRDITEVATAAGLPVRVRVAGAPVLDHVLAAPAGRTVLVDVRPTPAGAFRVARIRIR